MGAPGWGNDCPPGRGFALDPVGSSSKSVSSCCCLLISEEKTPLRVPRVISHCQLVKWHRASGKYEQKEEALMSASHLKCGDSSRVKGTLVSAE